MVKLALSHHHGSEESHSSSTPAPRTLSAEATPAGVTAVSPMSIKPTQSHPVISIPNSLWFITLPVRAVGVNVGRNLTNVNLKLQPSELRTVPWTVDEIAGLHYIT